MASKEKNIVAAGGCFPAGTRINTPSGLRFIEDIKEGDVVYAFDLTSLEAGMPDVQPGRIFEKKVSETFVHSFGEVGYTSPLIEITYSSETDETIVDEKLIVTGNHYILTPSRQSEDADEGFARAAQLEVGDVMWTQYGGEVKITAIEAGDEYDFVYNFEVEDLHTYIADGVRVHNGGGGKSSKSPVQAANTVRTKQVIRVLLSPGEGEVVGLKNADIAQSVFFDGTPLRNEDGSYNFENVAVEQRVGLPDQTVIPGFAAVESEQLLGLPVTAVGPVTRTLSSADIDAVRVTIEFPQGLQSISNKTGDANGTDVQFNIQRRLSLGTWENVISPKVTEMSSGPFTAAFLIQRPAAEGTWEFRVQRQTPDSTLNTLINSTNVKSYTEIQNANIPYNNRALVAITIGADSTNGRIPSTALDIVGMKVKVPSNYSPATRSYTGSWDGTFSDTLQWTDNPAWVIYDLVTNTRYGLGLKVAESTIDKWSFYAAAVYNDELVNDGKGTGTFEPRFTFNAQLMVQEDAWKTLNTIAATFNAKLYMHAGYLRIAQDRPASITRVINNSNVVEGLFTYSSTSASDTYTQCNVTFNDPSDNFLPRTVSEVASPADRLRYGLVTSSLAAYGATTEGQARRAAKWMLDTSLKQTSMVSFMVSLENAAFEPNEIFYLMDEDYSQTTQEGRILALSGTTVVLDKPIDIQGTGWTISVYGDSGVTTRTITNNAGVTSSINLASALEGVNLGDAYVITGAVAPRQFRLIGMTDEGDLTYSVLAVQYDPNKYARVEQGIIIPDEVYWQYPTLSRVDVPTALVVDPQSAINADGVVYRYLNVSWAPPADGSAQKYQFQWRRNSQPLEVSELKEAFIRVPADFSGVYEFFVNAINSAGVASPTLSGVYNFSFEGGEGSFLQPVSALQLEGGAANFNGTMRVVWTAPTNGAVKDFKVVLSTSAGVPFKTFYTTTPGFVYSYEENVADGGPRPAIQVTVFARDAMNNTSIGVAATFSSQASATITNLRTRQGGTSFTTLDLEVLWDSAGVAGQPYQRDPNFGYFQVQVLNGSTVKRTVQVPTAAFTYSFNDNVTDNGQDSPSANIVISVTSYNKFGVASSAASATFTAAAPPVPVNLRVVGGGTVFNQSDLNVIWDAALTNGQPFDNSNVFKQYNISVFDGSLEYKRGESAFTRTYTYTIDENTLDNGGKPIRNPYIYVSAMSVYNVSSALIGSQFTNPAPSIPSNISIVSGIGNYKVSFDQPVETDYLGTYVWASTTSNFTPSAANLVADIAGAYASVNSAVGTSYYVKVASYDIFGKGATDGVGLNVSAQSVVSAQGAGIPKSDTAPTTAVEGDTYINTTDGKLYRYHNGAWTAAVPAADLSGSIQDNQIAQIAAAKITGQVTDAQIAAVAAAKLTGTVQDAQIAAISASKISGTITAPQIGSIDATQITGQLKDAQIELVAAAKLVGQVQDAQISSVAANKLSGLVQDAQIAAVTATKIAGQVTDAQIAGVAAGKIGGQIVDSQIANVNAGKIAGQLQSSQIESIDSVKIAGLIQDAQIAAVAAGKIAGQLQNNQLASIDAAKLNGQVSDAQIAGLSAAKIGGQIVNTQIADNSISTPKLQAGSVTTGVLAAGSVQAANIAAGAVTTGKLLVTGQGKALNADPGFADPTAWTTGDVGSQPGTISFASTNQLPYGTTYLRATGPVNFLSNFFSVEAGKTYKVTTWALKHTGPGVLYLRLFTYDGNGTLINNYVLNPPTEGIQISNSWNRLTGALVAPAGAVFARICIYANWPNDGITDFTDCRAEEYIGADLIVDGAISAVKLSANSVDASKIVAGSITSTQIAAGTIQAGNIAAGSITTEKIAAGAITARSLVVADRDAVDPDPGFYDGSFWFPALGAFPGNVGPAAAGNDTTWPMERVLHFGQTSVSSLSRTFTVEKGAVYRMKVWMWKGGATTGGFTASIHIPGVVYDPIGIPRTGESSTGGLGGNDINWGAVPSNQWVSYESVFTTGSFGWLQYIMAGTLNGASDLYIGFQLTRMANANLIVDGAITAVKVAANAITADKIAAGQVTAEKIQAGSITSAQIAADTIQAANIAAGAITASELAAGAVTAGKIAAGTVTAVEIAAGSIGAREITISDFENMVNPGIGMNISGFNGGFTPQGNFSDFNESWWKTIGEGSPYTMFWAGRNGNFGPRFAVRPGDEYYCSFLTVPVGAVPSNFPVGLGMVTYDSAGNATNFPIAASRGAGEGGGGAFKAEGVLTVPAGSVSANVFFLINTFENPDWNAPGNGMFLGGVQFRRRNAGNLIVDGAISANKISAGAITADKIAAGQVTSEKIAAGSITAEKMTVNSIYGAAIVAGEVRTDKIAAQAITAEKIQTGTITAVQIAAGTITSDKIGANQILAGNIAAGAITTGKLLVTGEGKAINADPGFIGTEDWRMTGGSGSIQFLDDGSSPYGARTFRANGPIQFSSGTFPLETGAQYKVTTWARKPEGNGLLYLRMYCFDAAGGIVNFLLTPTVEGLPILNPGNYTWARYTGTIVAGPGVVKGAIIIHSNWGGDGSGFTDFADCRVEQYIGADLIVDGAIVASKLAANSVDASKIVAGSITSGLIAADTIQAGNIAANAITSAELAADSVIAAKILAGAVSADKLAVNSVTADKIVANAVTTDKINAGAINADKIAGGTITAYHMTTNSIYAGAIASGQITADKIATYSITADRIAGGQITAFHMTANSIYADAIAAGQITTDKIQAGAVTADRIDSRNLSIKDAAGNVIFSAGQPLDSSRIIASGAWLNSALSIGANGVLYGGSGGQVTIAGLDSSVIRASNPITPGNISTYIAGASIGTAYIANGAILNAQIGDAQITNAKIGDGQITSAKIGDAEITTAKIGVAQIDNLRLAKGNITDIRMISWQSQGPNMQSVPANGTPQPAYDWVLISPAWVAPYIGNNAFQTVIIVSFEEPSLSFQNHPSYLLSRPRLQYNDGGGWNDHPGCDSDSARSFVAGSPGGFKNTNTYHYHLIAYAGRQYRMVNYNQGIIGRVANGTLQSPIYTQPVCTHRLTCIFNLA